MHRINFLLFPHLTTEDFTLRQLALSDGNEIFLLHSVKEVNGYLDKPISKSLKMLIKEINKSTGKIELIYWTVTLKN